MSQMITAQLKNKQSRISLFDDQIRTQILSMNSLTLLEYECHTFVVTMVTILEQKQYT